MANLSEENEGNVLELEPYQFEPLRESNYIESATSSEESESDNEDFTADVYRERKGNTDW